MPTIEELYQIYLKHPSVQTDTRKLKPGDIFFALKGEKFNGNAFAKQAVEAGAAYVVIDDAAYEISGKTILVDNVLECLQQLAHHHRQQFQIPFIAITGSNGKTTTKELIHAVLSSKYKTYTTEGNLNNHIGIPLTLLRIKADAEIAVIEMGANHQKEIESYCQYALPTHGLITNCGKAHLEGFGGAAGVRKGKGELFDYLKTIDGTAFIFNDYDYLKEMSVGVSHIFSYGSKDGDITGEMLSSEPYLETAITGKNTFHIQTQLVGSYNFPNVLAAVCVGQYFKIAADKIKWAIENYTPSNSRSQLINKGSNRFIMDAYNANPSSMKLAIENFANLKSEKKVLLLGAMAELGEESMAEHEAIIKLIQSKNWEKVVLVGGDFIKLAHPYLSFTNAQEAKTWLQNQKFENTDFLVKGSRSMQMEKIITE
ncbi:MAG: UDP-N-acetylmuramoyl-tripeptide--D-alanyl-D-alanine ligase [Chitinophagaceae bacterium]|jgi:UDP-N-acetylmuramoyl-tripeptide--D-alanyl-D-alanine ligase|nr:UDP-N-acetylmuramoyl-tripeptide--D-alanyl-D-alanine ligase [Chitinophagaceae bacterium]HNA97531.1 UDP-N-acetylmuramoyl-tripeptide--D-alanyl-D-alanine ligase [Chitinophagaceae bacterium]HNJ26201.1 UDP-N-acetylmuramoyl-tripeptide--D-alanyl-D-alanine ligase [Chitinophagaceae bacterium]